MKQGTKEWRDARCGKITASCFDKVKTYTGKLTQGAETYMMELIGERLTGIPADTAGNKHTAWGNLHEPKAKEAFYWLTGLKIVDAPFVQLPDNYWIGSSPDGYVGDDAIVEIKCPSTTKEHVRNCLLTECPPQHKAQIQGNLWVTGRQECYFISYDPRVPYEQQLKVILVLRDEKYIEKLSTAVRGFAIRLQLNLAKMGDANGQEDGEQPGAVGEAQ